MQVILSPSALDNPPTEQLVIGEALQFASTSITIFPPVGIPLAVVKVTVSN